MNATSTVKTLNDSILLISAKLEKLVGETELLFQNVDNVHWYQEGWVIALISAFSTALLIMIVEVVKYFYKKRVERKTVGLDIYSEIATVILNIKKHRESSHLIVEDFKQKAIRNDFSQGHPNLLEVSRGRYAFYNAHLKNLHLLASKNDNLLVAKIKMFYDILREYDINSSILSKMFERFYDNNPMTCYQDIVSRELARYTDSRIIILLGYEIIAITQATYDIDKYAKPKKDRKKINKKIFKIKKKIINDIGIEAEEQGIDIIYLLIVISKYNLYKNIGGSGRYERTEDSLSKKIKLFIASM